MMKPDDSDRFSLDSTFPGSGFTGYNINLTSQTWRGPSEITPSWKDPSDVTQDYMLNEQDVTIDHFFVLGASKLGDSKLGDSKRGWTTWLTAAAEARLGGPNRVSGIAPAVIDFLDLDESMAHYRRAYEGVTDHITGRHVASVAILTTDATALVVQPKYLVGDIGGIPIKFATDVSVAQVPEPATFALLLLSCMVGLFGAFQAIGGKS